MGLRVNRALILISHAGDEVIGCGGLLLSLLNSSTDIIIVLTSTKPGLIQTENLIDKFKFNMKNLGIQEYIILKEKIKEPIEALTFSLKPDLIISPHMFEYDTLYRDLGKISYELYSKNPSIKFLNFYIKHIIKPNFTHDISDYVQDLINMLNIYTNDKFYINFYIKGLRRLHAQQKFQEGYILLNKFFTLNDFIEYVLGDGFLKSFSEDILQKITRYEELINKLIKLENELEECKATLQTIEQSTTYKFLKKYAGIVETLFPEGSFRRKIYKLFIQRLKRWI